jgi:protein SCO1/2
VTSQELGELTEEQRASAFAASNTPKERLAAFRRGRVPVPPKFIIWSAVALLVLGFGGEVGQHFFETYGKVPTVTIPASPPVKGTPAGTTKNPTLISLQVFMGLKDIGTAVAPTFTLTNQSGARWSLGAQRGKVVVLAFYNSICNDICPVLGEEIRDASRELGVDRTKVVFAIVNSDPKHTTISPRSDALVDPGLVGNDAVTFLSGSVAALNPVWSAYGIRILVGAKASEVSHNNVLYFVSPNGDLSAYASPFGVENKEGRYSLAAPSLHLYARAIAETADSLLS